MSQPLPEGATQPQFNINDAVTVESAHDFDPNDTILTVIAMQWRGDRFGVFKFWEYNLKSPTLEHIIYGRKESELRHYNPIWTDLDKLWRILEDEAQRQLGLDVTIRSVVYQSAVTPVLLVRCTKRIDLRIDKGGTITRYNP